MNTQLFTIWLALVMLMLAGCASTIRESGPAETMAGHPALSEQDKMQPCYQCHMDVTPGIYKEWNASRHGIGQVRCFQCHGGYGDLKAEPDEGRCAVCHSREFSHKPREKRCWDCHPSHLFTVHR